MSFSKVSYSVQKKSIKCFNFTVKNIEILYQLNNAQLAKSRFFVSPKTLPRSSAFVNWILVMFLKLAVSEFLRIKNYFLS